jgi:HEAT repeats
MPIKFHCPNVACARGLTVKDEAAGRQGKCPSCGSVLTVPERNGATSEEPDPYALAEPEPKPEPEVVLTPVSRRSEPTTATLGGGVYDGEVGVASKGMGPAVRFSAIGLGMSLLGKKLWTWALALLVLWFAIMGASIALTLITIPVRMALHPVMGDFAEYPIGLFQILALIALEGVLLGGLFRMALKQLDGHEFGVGDMFAVSDVALKLSVVTVIMYLITVIGTMLLVMPGLIAAGLLMFALPLVVDGGVGIADALRISFETLKRDWLKAGLFVFVLVFIGYSGVLPCLVGVLFTVPIVFLSTAAQYRRNFAPGAKLRRAVVEDPWAEAVGQPLSERREPRMPGLAWFLFVLGLLVPVFVVIAIVVASLMVYRTVAQQQELQRARIQGGAFPGFPDIPPGQLPPGFKMEVQPGQAPPGFPPPPDDAMKGQPSAPDVENAPAKRPNATNRRVPPRDLAGAPPVQAVTPKPSPAPTTSAMAVADLDSEDRNTRVRAFTALAKFDVDPNTQDQIAEKLRKNLNDPDIRVRAGAVRALGVWGGPDDTPALLAALNDPQKTVNRAAIEALGHRKDPETLGPLLARSSEPTLRSSILNALRAWGPEIEPTLIDKLKDDNRDVRETACQTLREIGTRASLIPLRNTLNDPDKGVVDQARRALQAVESRVGPPVKKRMTTPRAKSKR